MTQPLDDAVDQTGTTGTGRFTDRTTGCGATCGRRSASYVASRRALLGGVAALASVPLVAACGSAGDSGSGSGSEDGSETGSADGIVAGDVPVGGGIILEAERIVVTQPTEGQFMAFSAVCTHQGSLVTQIDEDGITCTSHGSVFSLEDGSPLDGPADEPLAGLTVTQEGDTLTVA